MNKVISTNVKTKENDDLYLVSENEADLKSGKIAVILLPRLMGRRWEMWLRLRFPQEF